MESSSSTSSDKKSDKAIIESAHERMLSIILDTIKSYFKELISKHDKKEITDNEMLVCLTKSIEQLNEVRQLSDQIKSAIDRL